MAAFIYAGLEPDTFNGNDTADNAGDAGLVGAYLTVSDELAVILENTHTGEVESEAASGALGPDPADFASMTVGGLTNTIEIGFTTQGIGELYSNFDSRGVAGGKQTLSVTATGYFSHELTVAYGAMSPSLLEWARNLTTKIDVDNAWYGAALAYYDIDVDGGADWTLVDDTVYEYYTDYYYFISKVNSDLALGTFDGDARAYELNARQEINAMLEALPNFPGPQHPLNQALNQALQDVGEDFLELLDRFFRFDFYLDGELVSPADVEALEVSDGFEWTGQFEVQGTSILFETVGSSVFSRDGEQIHEEIDYGIGTRALSYSTPGDLSNGGQSIVGTNGPDVLTGTNGDDKIDGENDNDWLDGRAGNDIIVGGTGNDIIIGGRGVDVVKGDAGADVFAFFQFDDTMIITDFEAGVDDLALVNFAKGLTVKNLIPYVSQDGNDVVIAGGTQEIRFENTQLSDLSADDVFFYYT